MCLVRKKQSKLERKTVQGVSLKPLLPKWDTSNIAEHNCAISNIAEHNWDISNIAEMWRGTMAAVLMLFFMTEIAMAQDDVITVRPVTLTPKVISGCDQAEVDLVFVLDASTSVTEPNFRLMKDFVKDSITHLVMESILVGVVIYSTSVYVQFQLNRYRTKWDVFDAVDQIPYRYGSTNTADALKTMRTEMFTAANGDRPGVPNICIVITDGISNINSGRTIPEAEQARAEGIRIYAIGVALQNTTELDGIASRPVDENRFIVQDFSELRVLRDRVFAAYCPITTVHSVSLPAEVISAASEKEKPFDYSVIGLIVGSLLIIIVFIIKFYLLCKFNNKINEKIKKQPSTLKKKEIFPPPWSATKGAAL